MNTLFELKQIAASYLRTTTASLTANGLDTFLVAANQARKKAELLNDFEFSRKLVKVVVNGVTGGDLSAAVDADGNPVKVKTVIEAGLLDSSGNLLPVIWTTTAESIERQRIDSGGATPRYPTDQQVRQTPSGSARFTFSGNEIRGWPMDEGSADVNYDLWMEVYSFQDDWTSQSGTVTVASATGVTDVNGDYSPVGTYNNFPLFIRVGASNTYFLYNTGTAWRIVVGSIVGQTPTNYFSLTSTDQSPAGTYAGNGTFTGTPTIVENAPTVTTSDIWMVHGSQYILWDAIVQLNYRHKQFVPRTEGNLPPPAELAAQGLQTLIEWDAYKFELFRRHNR